MAEISLIASIIGVAGAGAKLSIAIFDIASTIGAAGKELQDLSTEISLLCSVFKQLETVLSHAHFHYSNAAVDTARKILERCKTVFNELDDVVKDLLPRKNVGLGGIPSVDFASRVKWLGFKNSKVKLIKSTLESYKLTLGIMLSTMQLAEKASMRRLTITAETEQDDKSDRLAVQSLIISQQCSLERLERLEVEVEKEVEIAQQLPQNVVQSSTKKRRKSLGHFVQKFSGLSINTSADVVQSTRPPSRAERASVWLGAIVFGDESTPHPGMRIKRRLSSMDTAEAPNRLLLAWTDQGRTGSLRDFSRPNKIDSGNTDVHADLWDKSASLFASTESTWEVGAAEGSPTLVSPSRTTAQIDSAPLSPSSNVPGKQDFPTNIATALAWDSEAIDSIYHGESYEGVVSAIFRSFGTSISSGQLCLRVGYGGNERRLEDSEDPMKEFFKFKALGLNPRLFLCRDVH